MINTWEQLPAVPWDRLAQQDGNTIVRFRDANQIFTLFSERHQVPVPQVKTILEPLMAAHGVEWCTSGIKMKATQVAKLDRIFHERVVHGTRPLDARQALPKRSAEAAADYLLGRRKRIVKVPPPATKTYPRQATLCDYFQTVMVEKQQPDLDELREELQRAAAEAYARKNANAVDERIYKSFAYPLLSLIPFTNPETESMITFEGVAYTVERRFDLGSIGGSIQAYALRAPNGTSTLLFKGSTFPGDDGFAATWLADFTPGLSVGHIASRSATLREWIQNERNVTVIGASLGGALALHMSSLYPDHVGQVHAYNPAGLHLWNSWSKPSNDLEINIYYQWNDLVASMGYFPPGAKIYRIVPMQSHCFAVAHARVFAGEDEVTIFESTAEYENSRGVRHALTAAHICASPVIFTLIAVPTFLYRNYEFFSLSYLSHKEGTTTIDATLVITWLAMGALMTAFAAYILTHRQLDPVRFAIKQVGTKAFKAIALSIGVLGGLMTVGGLRALTRLHASKNDDSSEASLQDIRFQAPEESDDDS